jgi:hypothetical protein
VAELEAGEDDLRRTYLKLMRIADRVSAESSGVEILAALEGPAPSRSDAEEGIGVQPAPSAAGPFESIGVTASDVGTRTDVSGSGTSRDLRVSEAWARATPSHIEVSVGFPEVLAPGQTQDIKAGLEHHLRTKFDVRVQTYELDDAPTQEPRKRETQSSLMFKLTSTDENVGPGELLELVSRYMRRVEDLSSLGVDLADILGLRETVLTTPRESRQARGADPLDQAGVESRRDPLVKPIGEGAEEIVFDLGAPRVSASGKDLLAAGDFSDDRLRRDDATTPLVDLVLRHPGYSDMRIGQVLSILLSIEYHRALALAERAPCVIAWGLGQDRARSFKEVIESAGGKVVLVEPGSFGEA